MAQRDAETLLRAIRAHCLDCMGGSREQVTKCNCTRCSLHPHRMGGHVFSFMAARKDGRSRTDVIFPGGTAGAASPADMRMAGLLVASERREGTPHSSGSIPDIRTRAYAFSMLSNRRKADL